MQRTLTPAAALLTLLTLGAAALTLCALLPACQKANNSPQSLTDTFTITAWDSTQQTIAGTFSGETINSNNSADSLEMTNGKFSLTYTTTN